RIGLMGRAAIASTVGCRANEPRDEAPPHIALSRPPAPAPASPRPLPSQPPPPQPPSAVSLYERLGREPAIRAVIDDFVARASADARVNFARKGVGGHEWQASDENVKHVKDLLVQFVCMAAGGPQTYRGRPMKDVHAGMKISNAEFDAAVEDLRASLRKLNVPLREQNELIAIVETTRAD